MYCIVGRQDKRRASAHWKLRVLDLVEIFIKRQPVSPLPVNESLALDLTQQFAAEWSPFRFAGATIAVHSS